MPNFDPKRKKIKKIKNKHVVSCNTCVWTVLHFLRIKILFKFNKNRL